LAAGLAADFLAVTMVRLLVHWDMTTKVAAQGHSAQA